MTAPRVELSVLVRPPAFLARQALGVARTRRKNCNRRTARPLRSWITSTTTPATVCTSHRWRAAGSPSCRGFAGTRTITGKLSFDPQLPDGWDGYAFKVVYRGRLIEVASPCEGTGLNLLSGETLTVTLHGREVTLSPAEADA
ncbi:MAG: glycosyl hydrolase family 65 protein [Oscillospiraceae bacterium]